MGRTLALVLGTGALLLAGHADAAPGDGAGSGAGSDVDMSPDSAGSGAGDAPAADAPIVKDPKVAKKWLAAAQLLVSKGDAATKKGKPDEAKEAYANAVVAYGKAIEAGDDPTVVFALGALQDKLGNYPEAIRNYKLVAAAPRGVPPAITKQLPAKLEAASGKVGIVTLVITPAGATVALNGTEIGKAPLGGPLVLLPGAYKVTITADGFQPKEDLDIAIEAGAEAEKKLDLEPIQVDVHSKHEEAYVPPPPPKPHHPSKLPIYAGGAVAVIGLGAGIVLGELATRWHNKFVAPASSTDTRLDAQQFGRQEAHAADACFGGAVLGALFAGGWYAFRYRGRMITDSDESANPNAPRIVLAPWVQPDVGGLSAVGRF